MRSIILLMGILLLGCQSAEKESAKSSSSKKESQGIVAKTEKAELQNGDLIFHTSLSSQSQAIQIATDSKYSHMGIIYREGDHIFVYEAVQPVKVTPLAAWIKRGEGSSYTVKRLKQSKEVLTTEGIERMKKTGMKYLNKNYDLKFEWSDDKIYCSELVWKIYKEAFDIEIGTLQQLKDFDLSDKRVQAKMKERYGNDIPMEELVITPDRMFQSEDLITIVER